MNLLTDQWIPVRRRSGKREEIRPSQMTAGYEDDPIVDVEVTRPDFKGALYQFLIGLLQCLFAPDDDDEWIDTLLHVPSEEELERRFNPKSSAYQLGGPGPRFMQDLKLDSGENKPIGSLLIDAPGGNTLRNNLDLFIKRGGVGVLCPTCTALALLTLQTNAPSGGVGHRTSLRGGGPLTTLVVAGAQSDATLWKNLWLNVLPRSTFEAWCGNPDKTKDYDIFPWLAPTRTSEPRTGRPTTPMDAHPGQVFWAMPRRIRLDLDNVRPGTCDLCGGKSDDLVIGYKTKNYGCNYEGPWRHPLSPHSVNQQGLRLPVHPQPGGIYYRHWLGLVQKDDKNRHEPARVVSRFFEQKKVMAEGGQFRLWAFGYDMDNAKARCWYDSTIPIYHIEPENLADFEQNVECVIRAAGEVASNLRGELKKAWFERPKDAKGDLSFIDAAFWQGTEGAFYRAVTTLRRLAGERKPALGTLREWHTLLCRFAVDLFDQWATSGKVEYEDPKRIATARNRLMLFNRGRRVLGCLGISEATPTEALAKGGRMGGSK